MATLRQRTGLEYQLWTLSTLHSKMCTYATSGGGQAVSFCILFTSTSSTFCKTLKCIVNKLSALYRRYWGGNFFGTQHSSLNVVHVATRTRSWRWTVVSCYANAFDMSRSQTLLCTQTTFISFLNTLKFQHSTYRQTHFLHSRFFAAITVFSAAVQFRAGNKWKDLNRFLEHFWLLIYRLNSISANMC